MRRACKFTLVAAACAVCFQWTGSARASLYCEIVATADGFAAIRAEPRRSARIVTKLAPDRMVVLDPVRKAPVAATGWEAVWVEDPASKRVLARGWLHKSLIKPDSCG